MIKLTSNEFVLFLGMAFIFGMLSLKIIQIMFPCPLPLEEGNKPKDEDKTESRSEFEWDVGLNSDAWLHRNDDNNNE